MDLRAKFCGRRSCRLEVIGGRKQLKYSIDVLDGRVQLSTMYKPIKNEICFLMKNL